MPAEAADQAVGVLAIATVIVFSWFGIEANNGSFDPRIGQPFLAVSLTAMLRTADSSAAVWQRR